MISDKIKGLIALAYLIIGMVFLSVGDAHDVNWYALFFENEHVLEYERTGFFIKSK